MQKNFVCHCRSIAYAPKREHIMPLVSDSFGTSASQHEIARERPSEMRSGGCARVSTGPCRPSGRHIGCRKHTEFASFDVRWILTGSVLNNIYIDEEPSAIGDLIYYCTSFSVCACVVGRWTGTKTSNE